MRMRFLAILSIAVLSCDDRTLLTAPELETCGPYPAPESSLHILPIPTGESSVINQGNCGPYTHAGSIRYAYDFGLEIGRTIIATRAGTVLELRESEPDGEATAINAANYLRIEHGDGTVASYVHLMQNGVLVDEGDVVAQGQEVALAGLTGFTGGFPHLHFEVFACDEGCDTIAITFSNASPYAPEGLLMGVTYTASPP